MFSRGTTPTRLVGLSTIIGRNIELQGTKIIEGRSGNRNEWIEERKIITDDLTRYDKTGLERDFLRHSLYRSYKTEHKDDLYRSGEVMKFSWVSF